MSEGFRSTKLADVTARLVDHDWAFPRVHEAAIAAHWQDRIARSPGMFDGTVLLCCAHTVEDGVARLDLFATRYSSFTYYRHIRHADPQIRNAFAAIVPWTADGAVLRPQRAGFSGDGRSYACPGGGQ